MRHLIVLAVLATLAAFSAGDTAATADQAQSCLESVQGGTLAQQQDCCKGHRGICGCRAGKIVCCDKTFAQGCSCNQEDAPATSS